MSEMKVSVLCDDVKFAAAFRKLCAADLPVPAAFKIAGIKQKMKIEIDKFIEVKKAMIDSYGVRGEDGNVVTTNGQVQLDPARAEEWKQGFADLGNITCEIDSLSINELGAHVKLSGDDVFALGSLITQ